MVDSTPHDWARQSRVDRYDHAIDGAIIRNVERDHSPKGRPEVKGMADTYGWNRYGGPDGTGPGNLVVGRAAKSQNRRER